MRGVALALCAAGVVCGWLLVAVQVHRDHRAGGPVGMGVAGWCALAATVGLVLTGATLAAVSVFGG